MNIRESHVISRTLGGEFAGNAFIVESSHGIRIYAVSHGIDRHCNYSMPERGKIIPMFTPGVSQNTRTVEFANSSTAKVIFQYSPSSDIAISTPEVESKIHGKALKIDPAVKIGDELTVVGCLPLHRKTGFRRDVKVVDKDKTAGLIIVESRGGVFMANMSGSALIREPRGSYIAVAMLVAGLTDEDNWLHRLVQAGKIGCAEILPS